MYYLFIQQPKQVLVQKLLAHVLRLVVVIKDDQLINRPRLVGNRLNYQGQRREVPAPCWQ